MKHHNDYVSGPHHYWTHFVCGCFFGGGLGAYVANNYFESGFIILIAAAVMAVVFGFSCGRWGERTRHSISDWLHTWWQAL
jgi:ABC-type amino acid transport system permease subunit